MFRTHYIEQDKWRKKTNALIACLQSYCRLKTFYLTLLFGKLPNGIKLKHLQMFCSVASLTPILCHLPPNTHHCLRDYIAFLFIPSLVLRH